MKNPLIAIVGRPNVGKSTFFNRVLSQRKSIVDPIEGITRDRIYGDMDWVGHKFTFVDTGGYIPEDLDIFNSAVREQAQAAIGEADLILFMVDGRHDPTASDLTLAQFVRETGKPALLVVNKCDSLAQDDQIHNFHSLGTSPVFPVSALTGRLTGDLLDGILKQLDMGKPESVQQISTGMKLAIVGMPNVGKSSLLNRLLKKEQTIVTPLAGTTRDSIDTKLKYYGKEITLVDTAGMRRKSKILDNIEFYSNVRTIRAIEHCDVAAVLIDAQKGFGKQDKAILDLVIKKGKGLVIIVNKWDLIQKETDTLKKFTDEMNYQFKALENYPVLYISALTKQRVSKVLKIAAEVYLARQISIPTSHLNKFLQVVVQRQSPPATKGKAISFKYMTQVHKQPPVFAIFTNYPNLVPTGYRRFLENRMREEFALKGVPIRLSLRKK